MSNNSSLIDNIFVNKQERLNFAGILNNEISDHQVIAININLLCLHRKLIILQCSQIATNPKSTEENTKKTPGLISLKKEIPPCCQMIS